MRTKLIPSKADLGDPKARFTEQMMLDSGIDTEFYTYECPCGKGEIIEEHDNTPGFREHDVYIKCSECKKHWKLDTSKGVRSWELIPID